MDKRHIKNNDYGNGKSFFFYFPDNRYFLYLNKYILNYFNIFNTSFS